MSHYISGKLLPWKRFWVPWDGKINCGDDGKGFLRDPDDDWGRFSNPEVLVIDTLLEKRCVILSGHPGTGKTVTVENAVVDLKRRVKGPDIVLALRCRDIPSAEVMKALTLDSSDWRCARENSGDITLVIDGVDEGLRKVPEFARTLRALIAGELAEKLRLVLVCRSAEWDVVAGQELMGLWPEDQRAGVMELCPLRQCDAAEAAAAMKLDADAFIEAVYQRRVQGMAARPITLKMLLKEFARGREFPGSTRTLYLRAAHDLCKEFDEDRERLLAKHYRRPPEPRIFRVVSRIAALVMFGGKSVILRSGGEPASHELLLSSVVGGNESIDGDVFEVTSELVDAALETPHFSFRGQNRFGFDHQTFAEILAAEYVREFELPQLRRLLCLPLDGREYVVPQLAEVASWLACSRPDWADFLIQNDPEVLLRSDISELTDSHKEKTVTALLDRAARLEVFSDISLRPYYRTLRHHRLTAQLRPVILDSSRPRNVRELAIDIAGHARMRKLAPDLWWLLRNQQAPDLFNTITHAIERVGNANSRTNWLAARRGKIPGDTHQDLLGVALRVAVPTLLPVRKVLPFLEKPIRDSYFGSYRATLTHHLPNHVAKADLPQLLRKLSQWPACFDSLSPFHRLAEHAFDLALDHLRDRRIRKPLVSLWIIRARKFGLLPDPNKKSKGNRATGLRDLQRRLAFVRALLNEPGTKGTDLVGYGHSLLNIDDLPWLLTELPKAPKNRRKTWAEVTASFAWSAASNETSKPAEAALSKHATAVIATCSLCPELKAALPISNRFDTVTMLLRHVKARELWLKRHREALERRNPRPKPLPRRKQLTIAFQNLRRTKHPSWWVPIVQLACRRQDGDPSDTSNGFQRDITQAPGWQTLTTTEKRLARKAAREFLIKCTDSNRPTNQLTNFSEAGYHAIVLNRREIAKNRGLRRAVINKWVPTVVDYFNNAEPEHQEMIAFIYHLAPAQTVKRLLDHLRKDAREEGFALSLRAFARCWDARLSSTVVKFAERAKNPSLLRNVLLFIAEQRPAAMIQLIRKRFRARSTGLQDWRNQAFVSVALLKFSSVFWDQAWKLIASASKAMSVKFFLSIARDTDERSGFLSRLSEPQLATLYLRLVVLFPPQKDPPWEGSRTLGAPDQIRRLRDFAINQLVGVATQPALDELQKIIRRRPRSSRDSLMWYYQKARRNRLQKLWTGRTVPPNEILALSRVRDARLVETEDDLVEVILDSLVRLEKALKEGGIVSVYDLWNTPSKQPASPKAEEFVSKKIAAWLRQDLGNGLIVNREVQVESLGGGRSDLKIEAHSRSAVEPRVLIVIIEVKRSSHRDVAGACKTQLVNGYLRRNAWTHGIYLVAWFGVDSVAQARWTSVQAAQGAIRKWVSASVAPTVSVSGCLLDLRLNALATPSS